MIAERMGRIRKGGIAIATLLMLASCAQRTRAAQNAQQQGDAQQQNGAQRQGAMTMRSADMQQEAQANPDATKSAMGAMSGPMGSMHMNAHMFMTALRPKQSGDDERAAQIVETVRAAMEKYKDYHVALADRYRIFGPNVPQPIYHFTNYWNAMKASFTFDPSKPTSLLYKKENGTYVLVGAMFTAPKRFTEDQLNARVPLSVARWHKHVNLCLPPRWSGIHEVDWKQFGPNGSIATQQACEAAGGRWIPEIFGWMVHVYPYETDPKKIWAH
ncbi:MAG TPA: hypothetical protein VMF66_08880 [Candidatus Acidoferrum sp.]|nr:hypothetical protein [Candidatus Acidoferrum sp.]